jgi:hypothetical protein
MMQEEMIEIMKKAAADSHAAPAEFEDASLFGIQPRIKDLDLELDGLGFDDMGSEEDIPISNLGPPAHVGFRKVLAQREQQLVGAVAG